MSSTVLINGKHPKLVIIDYYDDLISKIDIYAEETLKQIGEDEKMDDDINNYSPSEIENNSHLCYVPRAKQFEDPYSAEFTFDESTGCGKNVLVKDFINSERKKAINELKLLQKERLDELKLATVKPTTIGETLLGKKIAVLIRIFRMKFRFITLVLDFYLENYEVKFIENKVNELMIGRDLNYEHKVTSLDEQSIAIHLLAKYMSDFKVNKMSKQNSESVHRVNKAQLFAIEKILFYSDYQYIQKVAIDGTFDFSRLKSLELMHSKNKTIQLNLNGLVNLENLSLIFISIDLEKFDPFKNLCKLRQLKLEHCDLNNVCDEFFMNFPNLEIFAFKNSISSLPLNHLSNLKCLTLDNCSQQLDFLQKMPNLIILELENFQIKVQNKATYNEFNHLEVLRIPTMQKSSCYKYLLNLKELYLDDVQVEDVSQIACLINLEHLCLQKSQSGCVFGKGCLKTLKKLKSLKFTNTCGVIETIEENAFEGLENLVELEFESKNYHVICFESHSFKGICGGLKRLTIRNTSIRIKDNDFFDNFPNLIELTINASYGFEITERTFMNVRNLKTLTLNLGHLETLPENIFANLNQLEKLDLRGNQFDTLNENSFNGLTNLKYLDLNRNIFGFYPLLEFNFNCLDKMPRLKILILDLNISNLNSVKNRLKKLKIDLFYF